MSVTILLIVVAAVLLLVLVPIAIRTWLLYRGTRIVTCPETQRDVAVEPDVGHAVRGALVGSTEVRLRDCTRWPERADCGQECLTEIHRTPVACQLKTILTRWYEGESCVLCGKPFGTIHWHDHQPALRDPTGRTVQWDEFKPEEVRSVLETHAPVCWDCHIAARFRMEHGDQVVNRGRSMNRG